MASLFGLNIPPSVVRHWCGQQLQTNEMEKDETELSLTINKNQIILNWCFIWSDCATQAKSLFNCYFHSVTRQAHQLTDLLFFQVWESGSGVGWAEVEWVIRRCPPTSHIDNFHRQADRYRFFVTQPSQALTRPGCSYINSQPYGAKMWQKDTIFSFPQQTTGTVTVIHGRNVSCAFMMKHC